MDNPPPPITHPPNNSLTLAQQEFARVIGRLLAEIWWREQESRNHSTQERPSSVRPSE